MQAFDLIALESAIADTQFAGSVVHLPTVASTNDLALATAHSRARCGVWIADEQTAGRGRGDHRWHSAPGEGLYLTALSTPPIPLQSALQLSLSVAIAVQSAIASTTGLRAPEQIDIRWPNDLLLHGRKVAGILIETAAHPAPATGPTMLHYAVIGIGINCNHLSFPSELDGVATSLRRELPGTPVLSRETLAAAILVALDEEIGRMIRSWRGTQSRVDRKSADYSTWIVGRRVRVEPRAGEAGDYTGTTAGLTSDGFLLVRADSGELRTVLSGGLREP